MKNVMIVNKSEDYNLSLNESVVNSKGVKTYILGGTFTELGVVNRNNRIYTEDNFIPCLNEMTSRMSGLGVVYGEYDHPEVFDLSLQRASHVIKEAIYDPSRKVVSGKIKLLSNYWGREAKSIIDDGEPLFVSSRAAGVTESNGQVTLKKLFTYDIVADPGFASASMQCINESCGFSKETMENYRIFEMKDDSKINELINMNKNDLVTRSQMIDYSTHLVNEIATVKRQILKATQHGNVDSKKLVGMMEYYENLHETQNKIITHLNYLADTLQIVVNENIEAKKTISSLSEENKNLQKRSLQTEGYVDYLAGELDKGFSYVEYLSENVDKNIAFGEYIAEQLNDGLDYLDYVVEEVDNNTNYLSYIAESLDKSIGYGEHLAETVDYSIQFSQYLAENLESNLAYTDYVVENADKTLSYAAMIAEKLNGLKPIKESFGENEAIPSPIEFGFEMEDEEEETPEVEENAAPIIADTTVSNEMEEEPAAPNAEEGEGEGTTTVMLVNPDEHEGCPECETEENTPSVISTEESVSTEPTADAAPNAGDAGTTEMEQKNNNNYSEEANNALTDSINALIEQAKKQKANETNEHHFLKFLSKVQSDNFHKLTADEQEKVVLYLNEKRNNYFSQNDVLKLMTEALSASAETLEERLVRLMPEEIKESWSLMNESQQATIFSQARLHTELSSDMQVEYFWITRNIVQPETSKTLVNEGAKAIVDDEKLSDEMFNNIITAMKKWS